MDEVLGDAEVFGDLSYSVDVMHLVALHSQAATAWALDIAAFQFHGSSSSICWAG